MSHFSIFPVFSHVHYIGNAVFFFKKEIHPQNKDMMTIFTALPNYTYDAILRWMYIITISMMLIVDS